MFHEVLFNFVLNVFMQLIYSVKSSEWIKSRNLEDLEILTNRGATKTRDSGPGTLDRPGLAGTRSQVLAFGSFGSRIPGFDVIAITDIICFLPLTINDSDAMCIVI